MCPVEPEGRKIEPTPQAWRAIRTEARARARKHGLGVRRWEALLKRVAYHSHGEFITGKLSHLLHSDSMKTVSGEQVLLTLDSWPTFDEALEYLSPEEAMALYEENNLDDIEWKNSFIKLDLPRHRPGCSLDDLARMTMAYLEQLKSDHDHFVKHGWRQSVYSKASGRLGAYLGGFTYYADTPVDFDPQSTEYKPLVERPDIIAAILPSLPPEDAGRLTAGHEKLLNLKTGIVTELLDAVRERNSAHLWDNCLKLMTDSLTREEIDFYLRMDSTYKCFELRVGQHLPPPAALWPMLKTIGFFEEELTIGMFDHINRQVLQVIPKGSDLQSYFETVGRSWGHKLDAALNRLIELIIEEEGFWMDYEERLVSTIEKEFKTVLPIEVKSMFSEDLGRPIQDFANLLQSTLETGTEAHFAFSERLREETINLKGEQEREFRANGFRSRLTIVFTGKIPRQKTNEVRIGSASIQVSDRPFLLLLRLVVELFKGGKHPDGYVYVGDREKGGGLVEEGIIEAGGVHQAIGRLKEQLGKALKGTQYTPKDLIERNRTKHIRLSTHRAYIAYDRDRLLQHNWSEINKLAQKLPKNS